MTSKTTTLTQVREELEHFPDYPPRDDMQNWRYLYDTSVLTSLDIHYADEPDVTVASEVPVEPSLPVRNNARLPDLMFGRGRGRGLMEEQRGYANRPAEQGSGLRARGCIAYYWEGGLH